MSGKIKSSPRYEVVSFRTTKERREVLDSARGNASVSEFIDMLVTLYLQEPRHGGTSMEHGVCSAST